MAATDFNFFLQQKNPYKQYQAGRAGSDLSGMGGWGYPTWDSVLKGTDWQNDQIAQNNAGDATSLSGPADTSNPFTTLRNVKNPGIDAAAQAVLGQITSLSGPQPDTVVRSTRSQPFADRLSTEFHNFDTDRDGNRASLADFTNNWNAAAPQTQANTDQEVASIGEFYDGTVRGELDKLAGARRIATAGALTPAIQAVLRNRNMGALLGGNDSYLDQQVLDRVGRLSRDAAVDNAEQLKGNYLYARAGQDRNVGVRSRLIDANRMRDTVPIQFGQQTNAADLARLYGIGAAENANTNYRVTNPQIELATKLGLLGDVSRIDLGNTFYGVQKPYEPNTAGYLRGMTDRWGGDPAYTGGGYGSAVEAILGRSAPSIDSPRNLRGGVGTSPQTGAREVYFQQAGVYPENDPNFSAQLWRYAQQQQPPQQGWGATVNPVPLQPWERFDGSWSGEQPQSYDDAVFVNGGFY